MTIEEIFEKFLTGTDQDKAEVREFVRRHENMHLLYDPKFGKLAVANADRFWCAGDVDDDEFDTDAETMCPHCGQPLTW